MTRNLIFASALVFGLSLASATHAQENGTAAASSIMLTVEKQLDAAKLAITNAKFSQSDDALQITRDALDLIRQAQTGAAQLSGDIETTRTGAYAQAELLMNDIESSVLRQIIALQLDDEEAYVEAKLAFNQHYTEIPEAVRMGPITEQTKIDPNVTPQPK